MCRNQVRYFITESQNCGRFNAYHWRIGTDQVFKQLDISGRQLLCVAKQAFRNLGAPTIDMFGDDYFISQPIEQIERFDSDISVIVIRKFVTEKENATVWKIIAPVGMHAMPIPNSGRVEFGHRASFRKTSELFEKLRRNRV